MLRLTSKRLLGLGFRGTQSPAAAASQLLLPRHYHERVAGPTTNPRNAGSFGRKTSPPSSSVATEWVKGKQMEEVPTIKKTSHKPANSSEILNYMGGLDGEENQLIKKLVNFRMKEGKRTRVRSIVYKTIHHLARTERDVIKLVADALENVKPICEVEKVGIAGTLYDVPGIVTKDRQQTLAVRWVLDAAFKRRTSHRITLEKCLSAEILDAHRKRGVARKKRESLHGLASTNRSFAHFRWW